MADGPPDCVIVQPIAEAGLAILREAGLRLHLAARPDFAELAPALASTVAVVTRNAGFPAAAIAAAPRLRVIGSHGAGTDAIDRAAAEARGIAIVNTPGANARSVAEFAIGLMLAAARRIVDADRAVRAGDADFRTSGTGHELHGRTLGLIGFGHVARHVAPLARAFGMTVVGFSQAAGAAAMAEAGVRRIDDLGALLAAADIVSLHASGGRGILLGANEIARMKPGALLVNTARGSLLDETALAAALQEGRLAAAALDVTTIEPLPPDSPLLRAPNLVLTPHLGGSTAAALDRTAAEIARRVVAALDARGAIRKSA
jgi:phosphoglycerate dehydrogenase-like enzyme